ncbi:MAG: helix-turn-helix domain-containing protein [Chloroflexi bacterium]|nr:helix-turn-helix domain-containing protein [Chloroflexota bacterium]
MNADSKYYPLYTALHEQSLDELTLTLSEIESLLGLPLPASARTRRAWWSNRSRGALQAQAWMAAGYHVETIDLENERITFRKPGIIYKVQRIGDTVLWNADLIKSLRHHMNWTQIDLADQLGMRQQTISEWENGLYGPKRSSSKLLTLIAEKAGFKYQVENQPESP